MYKILLIFLLVSAIAAPTLASDDDEDDESFVLFLNENGSENAYLIDSVAETVDSFIKEHGPNLKISPNGPKLELGKTWADYQAKADSILIVLKSK